MLQQGKRGSRGLRSLAVLCRPCGTSGSPFEGSEWHARGELGEHFSAAPADAFGVRKSKSSMDLRGLRPRGGRTGVFTLLGEQSERRYRRRTHPSGIRQFRRLGARGEEGKEPHESQNERQSWHRCSAGRQWVRGRLEREGGVWYSPRIGMAGDGRGVLESPYPYRQRKAG